jgi:hypothetical protein
MPMRAWLNPLLPSLVAGILLLFAAPVSATTEPGSAPDCPAGDPASGLFLLCFDDLLSLSATSAASFPIVDVVDATVFSEADAAIALGFDTTRWATTGSQGVLNNLVPVVGFSFEAEVTRFRVDVLALPGPTGEPIPVVVQGFRGGLLVDSVLSDVTAVIADGTHSDQLTILDLAGYDEVRLFAASGACGGLDCVVDEDGLFFADSVEFVVPEPGAAALLATALLGPVAGRRCRERVANRDCRGRVANRDCRGRVATRGCRR